METNAEQLLELIRKQKIAAIDEFLKVRQPEGVFLDFKEKRIPDGMELPHKNDTENFSKALSGFANAAGGILVWGIGDLRVGNHKVASKDKPIANVDHFVRDLNRMLHELVTRPIDGVQIKSIKRKGNESGYVVVYVPESPYAPHRAECGLKRYYRRVGDSFIKMEHYEIEDMFGRRQRPAVNVAINSKKAHMDKFELVMELKNEGRKMASSIGVDLEFPEEAMRGTNSPPTKYYIEHDYSSGQLSEIGTVKYRSSPDSPPLFPGEIQRIFPHNYFGRHFYFQISQATRDVWEKKELNVTVYADDSPARISKFKFGDLICSM